MRPLHYVSDRYPALSETFTRAEVQALRAQGLPVAAWSLHPPRPVDPQPGAEDPPLRYLPSLFSPAVLGATLGWLLRRPVALASALLTSLFGGTEPLRSGLILRGPLHVAWGCWLARHADPGGHFHAQFTGSACSVAWVAARLARGSLSFTAHSEWGMPLLRAKMRDAVLIVAISEHERQRLLARAPPGFPADRIVVNRLGIDPAAWSDAASTIGPDAPRPADSHGAGSHATGSHAAVPRAAVPRPFRLLTVGNLGRTKGHDDVLRACALLRDRGIDVEADVVGGGPLRDDLAQLHSRLDLGDRVRLCGPLPHGQVRELTHRADACVLACRQTADGDVDGIPIVLMEAMAAGRPVISTRVSAIPELIEDGVSGLLVPPDDPAGLADAIERLRGDAPLGESLGRAAQERIRRDFDGPASARRLGALLRPLLVRRLPDPVRVLHVITSTDTGGAERMLARTLRGMASRRDPRVVSSVICLKQLGPVGARLRDEGFDITWLGLPPPTGPASLPGWALRELRAIRTLRREIRRLRPHVVQSWLPRADLLARLAVAGTRVAMISSVRVIDLDRRWPARLDGLTRLLVDRWMAVSEGAADHHAAASGIPRDRVTVIPNALDDDALEAPPRAATFRARHGLPADTVLVACVARLHGQKALDVLIRALALAGGDLHAAIAGDGPDRASLEALASRLGVGARIHLLGRLDDPRELLGCSDIFALPSRYEGMPGALLEAMALGVASIATAIPGVLEIVSDGETALLVPPGDADALAAALARLRDDPSLRRRIGEAARARVLAGHRMDAHLDRVIALWESVAGR